MWPLRRSMRPCLRRNAFLRASGLFHWSVYVMAQLVWLLLSNSILTSSVLFIYLLHFSVFLGVLLIYCMHCMYGMYGLLYCIYCMYCMHDVLYVWCIVCIVCNVWQNVEIILWTGLMNLWTFIVKVCNNRLVYRLRSPGMIPRRVMKVRASSIYMHT